MSILSKVQALGPRSVALIALVTVTACESINPFQQRVELPCPSISVVPDADRLLVFREGPGRDILDTQHVIEIGSITQGCATQISQETMSGALESRLRPFFNIELGPASTDRTIPFDYFIVVSDQSRKIHYRESFSTEAEFPPNLTKIQVPGEAIILDIPIKSGQTGRLYQIYVGLTLTREQLAYNREQRRRESEIRAPIPRSIPE